MKTDSAVPPPSARLEAAGLVRLYDGARRLQEALAEVAKTRGTSEAVIEALRAPLIIVDGNARICAANGAFESDFGIDARSSVGRALSALPGLWASAKLQGLVEAALARDELIRDVALEGPAGPRARRAFLKLNARRIDTVDGARVVIAVEDVSAQRQRDELVEARRRYSRELEGLARVSHELRTPVAAIKGFAETLRRGGWRDERKRMEFIRTIERHSDRLGRIIEGLLTLYSLENSKPAYEPAAIELGAFLRRFAASLAPVARRRKLRLSVEAEPGAVAWADREQLERTLQSLCENAVRHARGHVTLSAVCESRGVVLAVVDDGPGIPPPLLPHLFDGVRGAAASSGGHRGTGLGLQIARAAAAANHGRLWAQNEPGGGSAFRFTVPAPRTRAA